MLGNELWSNNFSVVNASFFPEGTFDDCPVVVCMHKIKVGRRPFRFFDIWTKHGKFSQIDQEWNMMVEGFLQYHVMVKLRKRKKEFKDLNKSYFGDLHFEVAAAYRGMVEA